MGWTPIEILRNRALDAAATNYAHTPESGRITIKILLDDPDLARIWRRAAIRKAIRDRLTPPVESHVRRQPGQDRALLLRHAQHTGYWGAGAVIHEGEGYGDSGFDYWAWDTRFTEAQVRRALEQMGVEMDGHPCHTDDRDCCGRIARDPVRIHTYGKRIVAVQRWRQDV
jgi:hypothetical protein